jgi:predicted HAD superfamily phosphohydrolase
MPTDPPLADDERRMLTAIMRNGAVQDGDLRQIAEAVGLVAPEARRTLRNLEARQPPLVQSEVDAKMGERVWTATADGADALENP